MTHKRKPKRGGARPGAGRKPSAGVARTRYVPLRLTDAEYDAVAAAVELANVAPALGAEPQTISSWFRDAGVAAALAFRS